jgi:hypothetical protein
LVDAEKVRDLLAHLDELVPLLEETRAEGATRFLASKRVQHQTEREVQPAVQVCIDAGAHLVAQLGLGAPDDYRDVFLRLAQAGVISRELAEPSVRRPACETCSSTAIAACFQSGSLLHSTTSTTCASSRRPR